MGPPSLAAAGWPDPEVDALLDASLAPSAGAARERLPHRELEQDWLRWLHGGPVSKPGRLAGTAVGTGIDLLSGSRDDVYAFTHALLYAADFGGQRIDVYDSLVAVRIPHLRMVFDHVVANTNHHVCLFHGKPLRGMPILPEFVRQLTKKGLRVKNAAGARRRQVRLPQDDGGDESHYEGRVIGRGRDVMTP